MYSNLSGGRCNVADCIQFCLARRRSVALIAYPASCTALKNLNLAFTCTYIFVHHLARRIEKCLISTLLPHRLFTLTSTGTGTPYTRTASSYGSYPPGKMALPILYISQLLLFSVRHAAKAQGRSPGNPPLPTSHFVGVFFRRPHFLMNQLQPRA